MFSISQQTSEGFELLLLEDNSSGTSAVIIPACGAMLHAFTVQHKGAAFNVIDGYTSAAEFATQLEEKGFKGSKLSPFVCRLSKGQYHFGEQTYKVNKFYLGDHALHGLLYDASYTVWMQEVTTTAATVTLLHQYKGSDSGYPFAYDCFVTYTLSADNSLRISTRIVNQGGGLIPVQDGWHPYFTLGGSINDLQLEFQSKEKVLFDEALIPTGALERYEAFGSLHLIADTNFDNCFTLNFAECQPLCVLRNPQEGIQVEIHPDSSYPYLQVYTPPHRQSIAVENLSGAPDAFNNAMGLRTLEAAETAVFTTTYKITLLT